MLHTLKQARRIGLTVHFPYSLPLKMAAQQRLLRCNDEVMQKYAEIAYWVTSHAHPL